jgi:streptomycin 6-kinase
VDSLEPVAPVAITLPVEVLRKVTALGAAGQRWLDELGWMVAQLQIDWEIEVGDALSGGSGGFVGYARMRDGTEAVLKVAIPDGLDGNSPFEHELRPLLYGEGAGYVAVLRFDRDRRAMLQERLGRRLSALALPVEAQIDIIAATLQQSWRPVREPSMWRTGAEQAHDLGESVQAEWEALGRPCPSATIEQAVRYARSRRDAFDASTAVFVHGDAHPANVLEAAANTPSPTGFKLIDPDGMLSEPAHDLAIPLRDWTVELLAAEAADAGAAVTLGLAWCAQLGGRTGVDPQVIWEWAFLERVSTGLFLLRLGDTALGARFLEVAALWTGSQP